MEILPEEENAQKRYSTLSSRILMNTATKEETAWLRRGHRFFRIKKFCGTKGYLSSGTINLTLWKGL